MHNAPRFVFTINHLTDDQLAFFGWFVAEEGANFKLYRREHDGEHVVVQNDAPRWFVVDDPNDAQQMCDGEIIIGPDPTRAKEDR